MILSDKMSFKKSIHTNLVRMTDVMFDRRYTSVYYINHQSQANALYLFFYYVGSSVSGTGGGDI